MTEYFLSLALVVFLYVNLWFLISLIVKRNDIMDVAWGMGFVVLAWYSFYLSTAFHLPAVLVNVLVSIWGIRLAWHIYERNAKKNEDYRYKKWREEWGRWFFLRSYFQVYILQGFLMSLIALPIVLVNYESMPSINLLTLIGVLIWILGFFFEVVGDLQLARFLRKEENKDKIIQSGLWRYTRHPNYFGEVTCWWGIFLIALSSGGMWLAIIGPLTITFLILKVSGIPMLEKKMAENPDFVEYQKRTSAFFPLPPRR